MNGYLCSAQDLGGLLYLRGADLSLWAPSQQECLFLRCQGNKSRNNEVLHNRALNRNKGKMKGNVYFFFLAPCQPGECHSISGLRMSLISVFYESKIPCPFGPWYCYSTSSFCNVSVVIQNPSAPPLSGHRTLACVSPFLVLDELVYSDGICKPISDYGLLLNRPAP